MEEIRVASKQIKEMDEIRLDKISTKATLKIAMNYNSNRLTELNRKENKWWSDILGRNDIGSADKRNLVYDTAGAYPVIKEKLKDK